MPRSTDAALFGDIYAVCYSRHLVRSGRYAHSLWRSGSRRPFQRGRVADVSTLVGAAGTHAGLPAVLPSPVVRAAVGLLQAAAARPRARRDEFNPPGVRKAVAARAG